MSKFKGYMDLMSNSNKIEIRPEFNLKKDFNELIKRQDEYRKTHPYKSPFNLPQAVQKWANENPEEFKKAYENMIEFICKAGDLI